jgi:hypothetical protein
MFIDKLACRHLALAMTTGMLATPSVAIAAAPSGDAHPGPTAESALAADQKLAASHARE